MTDLQKKRKNMKTVFCLSLGCAKNRVDSERIAGVLQDAGYEIVNEPQGTTACIVNTCGFLRSAVEENIESILALAELKKNGETGCIGVVGCLVNRYGAELKDNLPEVDFFAECEDFSAILNAFNADGDVCAYPTRGRLPGHSIHSRYLKLAEGCDNKCSYCAIPGIRGNLKSLPPDVLLREAEGLVKEGAREICLVAQDLTAYGDDLGGGADLYTLLDSLEYSLPADIWLRLLYLHPSRVTKKLLERVANGRQLQPYLDIPIQHASPDILHAMNRGMGDRQLLEIFKTAREIRADFALRTTCMVGFPGEKRGDFDALLRFLQNAQFDRVGSFIFSREEGTPAAFLPSQIAAKTKKARLARLMALQEEISLARQRQFVGDTLEVMVDVLHEDGSVEGRSFREAPEVDGVIEIPPFSGRKGMLKPGDKIFARVTEAFEHDLNAEICADCQEV